MKPKVAAFLYFDLVPKIMVADGLLVYYILWTWSQDSNQYISKSFDFAFHHNIWSILKAQTSPRV